MAISAVRVSSQPINDNVERDPSKDAVVIELPDGSITVNLGEPINPDYGDVSFGDNLAEVMLGSDLLLIADDLVQGIEEDDRSRTDWLAERADAIKLLALKVEKPQEGAEGSGRSNVRDTSLLEAVLRFQANAGGELLPADGPVKVRDDTQEGVTTDDSELADDLETDLNHYLTTTATEYYPDSDRMLFQIGFGGTGFKKVYRCPIRRRPVSESVEAPDLIVGNQATDLENAERVTHVVKMSRATMRRMQILGAYRDVDLGEPAYNSDRNAIDDAKENLTGIRPSQRPQDEQYVLYECYCLLDLPGFEHKEKGQETGLPLPYKVVVEKTSRQILEIRRNWREDDDMQLPRVRFVKFSFVPAPFGFYDLGLHNIVGNPTAANTALLRILVDAGIFGNFPGFLYAKSGGRQNTLEFNVMPGQGAEIDLGGLPGIGQAVMPLPYQKPDGSTLNLMNAIKENAQRVSGTAELQVAEGRAQAPVGTTLAMIEQATKVLNAVHRRLHKSQAREFELLVELFRENPDDFWRFNRKPSRDWDEATFVQALNDYDLVPAADPNTSSNLQRIARAQAIYQMATQTPEYFNIPKVLSICGKALREPDFDDAVVQAPPPAPPPSLKDQAAMITAQASQTTAQAKAQQVQQDGQLAAGDQANEAQAHKTDQQVAALGLAKEQLSVQGKLANIHLQQAHKTLQDRDAQVADHAHERAGQAADQMHDVRMAGLGAMLNPPQPPSGGSGGD